MNSRILHEDLETILSGFEERGKLSDSVILVTGCAGFLGFTFMHFFARHATQLKIRKIIGLDNFRLQKPQWLADLSSSHKGVVEIREFDISKGDIRTIPGADKADYILHMASIASPIFYRKYPLETLEANIWGLKGLLDFYRERRIRGFLFFSSSEIYGDPPPEEIPTGEDYRGNVSCNGPRACYDESKRFGETLCWVYAQAHGLPILVARPFNNYGPGMSLHDQRVPADFARAVFESRDLALFSDGTPKRTFCYISDAITGYLKILCHGKYDFFNIGIDKPEISVRELADLFAEHGRDLFGYRGAITFAQSPDADYLTHNPNRRCPVIEKARQVLNFAPKIHVRDGVRRYLEFIKEAGGAL